MNQESNNQKILEQLQLTDIFMDIPSEILMRNLSAINLIQFKKGEFIIRKDDIGDTMYIIIQGKVKVHDEDFIVANLFSGDYFGEMSLLHTAPRSMSVSALENVQLIGINQESFYNILKDQPELIQKIISNLVIRMRSQNNVLIEELRSREEDLKRQVEEQTSLYREQKERAEQSEKFKQQFLANMSHEIRTPMNAVVGMTNLLIDKAPRDDQRNYLDGIKKSAQILLHIINDILDLSKIEAGKMELEKIDFSLTEMVDQIVQTLQHKASEKSLKLISEVDANIPDILIGDPIRLNQVLMNLTGNAIKFTEEGSVTISISHCGNNGDQSLIKFSVTDTGIGIAPEKLDNVFEGFTQANTSDTRKFGGTGLGLTISKQLVEMMESKICIGSKEANSQNSKDHGTTFSFTISFPSGSVERFLDRIKSEENIDGSILDGKKILIVDDNEYNRIVATDTLLAKSKVEITSVDSGIKAIEIIKEKLFDIVLMDLQMPDMDGYEATKYIRNNFPDNIKNIPIVALTASVLRNDIDKCHQAGMNSYITKPFKASDLIAGIAMALNIELLYENKKAPVINQIISSEIKITNLDYLTTFCEGDITRMKKYIGMFVKAAPELIQNLEIALASNNFEEIANQVHSGRTKLVMMGMEESKNLAVNIEKGFRDQTLEIRPIEETRKLIQHLELAIQELISI